MAGFVWLHGGSFGGGSLAMPEADWTAGELSRRGVAVITVDYHLVNEAVRFPIPSDDVLCAWSWAVEYGARHGLAHAVHIGGASAGGNLALGASIRLRDGDSVSTPASPPASIVLAYPTLHGNQPEPAPELAEKLLALPVNERWTADEVAAVYRGYLSRSIEDAPGPAIPGLVDPAGLPPVLLVASEVDGVRASADAYARVLQSTGHPHKYIVEPGTLHGHLNRPDTPEAISTVERITGWLLSGFADAAQT